MNVLNVCNYNVRSISEKNPQAVPTLLAEISNFNWDIVGISETKIMDNAVFHVEDDHYLFNSGNGCYSFVDPQTPIDVLLLFIPEYYFDHKFRRT